jgi:hypothetical protein
MTREAGDYAAGYLPENYIRPRKLHPEVFHMCGYFLAPLDDSRRSVRKVAFNLLQNRLQTVHDFDHPSGNRVHAGVIKRQ